MRPSPRVCPWILLGALFGCGDDTTAVGEDGSSTSSGAPSTTGVDPTDADASTTGEPDASSSGVGSSDDAVTGDGSTSSEESTTTGSAESTDEGSTTDPSETGENADDVCPGNVLGPNVPDTAMGTTSSASNDTAGSCGGASGRDIAYTFTAPSTGAFTFDTEGSELDTVLYVLDGECTGPEIACNDDGAGSQSALTVQLAQDQTITVVVDGFSIFGDPYTLRVREGSFACPAGDLGDTVPGQIAGDTSQYFDGFSSSCGGDGYQDAAYLFTAPEDGTYSFDTFGSNFESVLYVLDGTCGGPNLGCAQDGLLVDLVAGQTVTVVVDGLFGPGAFELHVNQLGGTCPDGDLGSTVPQQVPGNTGMGDNTVGGSCGGAFAADDTWLFTAPADGLYSFDTVGSSYDTVLYVRDGGCDGPETGCNDNLSFASTQSRVTQPMSTGDTVMVAVDGNGQGPYTLNIDQIDCPDAALASDPEQTVFQTTFDGIDKLTGTCGGSGSPDYAWSFVAPADGEYVFDTFGTAFDTVLYVLDGAACNGTQLACNDNFQAQQTSAVSVGLVEGQAVTVVVDGQFGAQGVFQLDVSQLGGGACPDQILDPGLPAGAQGNTSAGDNTVAGSCGGLSQPDDIFQFTAPQDGLYAIDTFGSGYDTVLFVRDGDCNGAELACNDNATFNTVQSQVSTQLTSGQTIVIAVDGNASGAYDLHVNHVPCPDLDLGDAVPVGDMGTTVGAVDKLQSVLCQGTDQGSPDVAIEWTAPAADLYTFDLSGSTYDTFLMIQDAACGGPELGCNDDFNGLQSYLEVNLAAGQTVIVVVSGYFGNSGDYTLAIGN